MAIRSWDGLVVDAPPVSSPVDASVVPSAKMDDGMALFCPDCALAIVRRRLDTRVMVVAPDPRMPAERIHLRPAVPADAPLLRRWDDAPHVVASDPNDDWRWETELERSPSWREQLVAEADGRPIGFVQIIDPALEDSHYWGDAPPNLRAIDLWIGEADMLGRGFGSEMMRQALARCFAPPEVEAVLIDPLASNADAIRFYRRFGFEFVEARDFGDDHCHVHRLSRTAYLRSCDTGGAA
jgi:aminoglycoside 6'-N-acetyltransferase